MEARIKDIFSIAKGRKAIESNDFSDYRYIQIDDLRNNDLIKYCIEDRNNIYCTPEDILIAWDGANAGTVGYGIEGAIGSTIARLRTQRKDIFIPYVGRFLRSKSGFLRDKATGATIPHISRFVLENLTIPLPPYETQKQIAAILDNADELRQNDKKILEKYDQLARSVFLEMFGDPFINPKKWPLRKIKEIAEKERNSIKAGPFGSSLKKEFYTSSGYKIYGQEQVIRDDFNYGSYYINEDLYQKLESCKIKEGDILISLVGSYGLISLVPQNFEPGIINPRLMKITVDRDVVIPAFLKFILQSDGIRAKIKNSTHGGTMAIVNVGIIKEIEVPIPPIELQERFLEIHRNLILQQIHTQQSIQKSEELFQSLLQMAFNGELR